MKNNNAKSSKTNSGGQSLLTPAEFTEKFASALRATVPGIQVQIEKDWEINYTPANGMVGKARLDNAWKAYLLAPENKEQIMRHHVRTVGESSKLFDAPPDNTRILPVLKHKQWIQNNQSVLKAMSGNNTLGVVYEPYNDELIVVYAEDMPNNILYLTPGRLEKLNLKMADLQNLALHNLRKLLPIPKVEFAEGVCWIRAGGSYDTSLLLLDDFWNHAKLHVRGEIVAAIPARNCLVVTGSQDAKKVQALKRLAQMIEARADYPLTSKLHVRRQGRFLIYEP
jgi:uncharacterized protein YtpQ (UPF0354 family)